MSTLMMSELDQRNRRLRKILLTIMAVLMVAGFLVGIRW